jgi:hypothetical protein
LTNVLHPSQLQALGGFFFKRQGLTIPITPHFPFSFFPATIQMSACLMPLQRLPAQLFYGSMFRQHEIRRSYPILLETIRLITLGSAAISGHQGSLRAIANNG